MGRKCGTSRCCSREEECGCRNGFGGSWIIFIIIILIFFSRNNRRCTC